MTRDKAADRGPEARLEDLDATVVRGVAAADAGEAIPAGAVFDRLEARYSAQAKPVENWLREDVAPTYDAHKADPGRVMSAEELQRSLKAHMEAAPKAR